MTDTNTNTNTTDTVTRIIKLEEQVKELLDNGADVNEKNNDGWTPLHEACYYVREDTVKLLIEKAKEKCSL